MYLAEFRFHCFEKATTKNSMNLASLPPTRKAAREHSFRVYHQMQIWLGNQLPPTNWGWKQTSNGLLPITTTHSPVPEALLKIICCKCTKGCSGNCSCRKVGLYCSSICTHCQGRTCSNISAEIDIEEDIDETVDIDMENFLSVQLDKESDAEETTDSEVAEGDADCDVSPARKKLKTSDVN